MGLAAGTLDLVRSLDLSEEQKVTSKVLESCCEISGRGERI